MKWSQYGRITLALVASLALGLSITACNPSFTLGFVYVLNSKTNPGTISAYSIDSVSGAITQVANSPFSIGQQYPIAAAVSNNSKWLYVVNEVDNTVVQFNIGTDGKLYKNATYNTPGTYPIAMTLDPTSKFLFVVDSYAPGFNGVAPPNINPLQTNSVPTQGCVAIFPIDSTKGTLTAPTTCTPIGTPQIGAQPIGVSATAFVNYLYVADQGTHAVYAYSVNYQSGAALTPLNQVGYQAGVKPSAIVADPSGRFVYVTDQYQNEILAYNIQADGSLVSQVNGPFPTDLYPYAMVVDPRGKFLYVANRNANNVFAYAINPSTGNPSKLSGGAYGTDAEPSCLTIEPAYGRYVYVANFLSGTVSGFKLDPATGVLKTVLNSPFPAGGQPTCLATAANGTHPVQSITP
jgi:6-phosphogluconolactonase (cycloisomerase 2 family)